MKIGIVGLGLISGSFAKAISRYTPHQVLGHDSSASVLRQALACGAVAKPLGGRYGQCGLVLVALFPKAAAQFLAQNAAAFPKGCLVVDLCGVKRFVCEQAEKAFENSGAVFIGGHPMAGKERFGFAGSSADLFQNASMILTPDAHTPKEALANASDFFRSVGFARIQLSTPQEHDRIIAFTSQLAYVLSSAYARCPTAGEYMGFSAGSFQDLTRVARLNEAMWSELFLANGDFLTGQIDELIAGLAAYRHAIASQNLPLLKQLLREGRLRKETLDAEKHRKEPSQ